jgi:hypothetical protein
LNSIEHAVDCDSPSGQGRVIRRCSQPRTVDVGAISAVS